MLSANYREDVHVWEDLDLNLRVSGRKRTPGGGSEMCDRETALQASHGGVWLDHESKRTNGQPILDADDPPGAGVICKCYRFQFIQDQASSKEGGCAGNVARLDDASIPGLDDARGGAAGEGGLCVRDASSWDESQVGEYLRRFGIKEEAIEVLKDQEVDGDAFLDISESLLYSIGLKAGPITKILKARTQLLQALDNKKD